ncbi:unnamed protein product [marine sediment metagenome]|uniref:Uncharacterized protein n=1 Tax=marine sediment metagenome TaxID=412755 RepID=X1CUT3_9ZZZZ
MAHMELRKYSTLWAPADSAADEANTPIFGVSAGEYVVAAAYKVETVFGPNCVINFGDGDGEVSYDAIAKGVTNVLALTKADGAYLANSMGKLYTSDDTIDVDYTAGASNASGKMRFFIVKGRLEP